MGGDGGVGRSTHTYVEIPKNSDRVVLERDSDSDTGANIIKK